MKLNEVNEADDLSLRNGSCTLHEGVPDSERPRGLLPQAALMAMTL